MNGIDWVMAICLVIVTIIVVTEKLSNTSGKPNLVEMASIVSAWVGAAEQLFGKDNQAKYDYVLGLATEYANKRGWKISEAEFKALIEGAVYFLKN